MDGALRVLRAAWPESLAIIVATPSQHLATKASRAVLPELISREDAIFNVQRVAFLLEALRTADFTLLREALEDRLHQPYRAAIVPGLKEALALRHPSLLGVCLSGAGPSIAAFAQRDLDQIAALLTDIFTRQSIPATCEPCSSTPPTPRSPPPPCPSAPPSLNPPAAANRKRIFKAGASLLSAAHLRKRHNPRSVILNQVKQPLRRSNIRSPQGNFSRALAFV